MNWYKMLPHDGPQFYLSGDQRVTISLPKSYQLIPLDGVILGEFKCYQLKLIFFTVILIAENAIDLSFPLKVGLGVILP